MKKRLCSLLTALCLVLTLLPAGALATEDTSTERDPVEHAAVDSAAQEDTAPESTVLEDAAPEDAAPESPAPENTASESTDPESPTPENSTPENSTPESGAVGSVSDVPETAVNEAQTDLSAETGIFSGGTGTAQDPYLIGGLDELKAFRDSVNGGNNYSRQYIQLTADIDLGNEEWVPIGGAGTGKRFAGIFDGDGHTISNLKITRGLENTAANNSVGLFGACASPATLQNMTLENVDVQGSLRVGAVLGDSQTSSSIISNVHVTGSVRVSGWWYVGGIMGQGYGTVTGCSVEGDGTDTSYVKITGGYTGGIVGFMGEGNCVTADCSVKDLTVEGLYNGIGGINGILHYGNTIRDCTAENVVVWQTTAPDAEEGNRIYCGAFAGTYLDNGGSSVPNLIRCEFTGELYSGPEKTDILEPTRYVGSLWYGAEPPSTVKIENCTIHMRPVAQVGSETYFTLSEALGAAESGDTVKLLADVALTGGSGEGKGILTIAGKSITLDGAGHVLTAAQGVVTGSSMINVQYTAGGTVTIKDLTIDSSRLAKHGINLNGASVSLENVWVKGSTGYGVICNGSTLSVDGLSTSGNGWGGINVDATAGTGSCLTVTAADLSETGSIVLENQNAQSISASISGGTFHYVLVHPTQATHLEQISVGITGGTFEGLSNISSADPDKTAAMTVSGGIFTADPTPYLAAGHRAELVNDKYQVSAVKLTVTFESNSGSAVDTQDVDYSGKVNRPADPTRTGYTFAGWYSDAGLTRPYDFSAPVTADLTLYAKWTQTPATDGGSSGGGGSSSGDKTETVTHPDGSTTTTVTKPNGTVTETTKQPDGSQQVVESQKDGTVTTTNTDADGNRTETVSRPDGSATTTVERTDGSTSTTAVDDTGKAQTQVTLPQSVVESAGEDQAVALPMPVVPVTSDRESAATVTVTLPGNTTARVEIPVEDPTPGTVAVIVRADGTEEVVKTSLTTENGVTVTLSDGDTVKIVDNSKSFLDVDDTHWASGSIDFATSRELFSGTGADTFSPDVEMTRAMVVTVLARYVGEDTSTGGTWYEAGRQWAVEAGISDGTGMDDSVTREQLVTMLYRFLGQPKTDGDFSAFRDGDAVSPWAADAMAWAVSSGILDGMGDGSLAPRDTATRAQVAAVLARFVAET